MSTPPLTPLLAVDPQALQVGALVAGGDAGARGRRSRSSRSTAEEIVLRVRAPGRLVAPTVVLYPTENESECDCPARVSPCEHVAAAAIVLGEPVARRRADGATAAPRRRSRAAVGWARRSATGSRAASDGLRLARVLVAADGARRRWAARCERGSPTRPQAARLQVEDVDLRVDELLEASGARRAAVRWRRRSWMR